MVAAAVVIVVGIIVLLNRSSKEEKAVKATSLDSVLTTPSSLGLVRHGSHGLMDSSFTVTLKMDSTCTFFDGNASAKYMHEGWRSVLIFTNVAGVSEDSGGPYDLMSLEIEAGYVVFVKVSDYTLYRVTVKEAREGTAKLVFEKM